MLAHCLAKLESQEIERLALAPLTLLPDEPFFDAIADFLPGVDMLYFGAEISIEESAAVDIRARLAERLMESSGWKRMAGSRDASVEIHIGPAIAALFFNEHGFVGATRCYLLPKGIDRLGPFLPVLEKLVQSGPSPFVALVAMNLLEVSPRSAHLPSMVAAASAWLAHFPNNTQFWVDMGFGRRVSIWIENVSSQDATLLVPDDPLRIEVDRILAGLIRLGVVEARRIEQALAMA